MYDFDSLINEILRKRPDVGRSRLDELIQEKKTRVGAGYLTDQGALFLIAGELGVQLSDIISSDLTLKDLYIGANDITIVARVLGVYPTSEYERKDGTRGRYRRLNLFDQNGIAKLTVWDDVDGVERLSLQVDTPLRVVNGYVKQGLDGKPALNLGKRGRMEIPDDEELLARMPSIVQLATELGDFSSQDIIAVSGIAVTESKTSSFTRSDGTQGTLTHFMLSDEEGKKRMRVVIWNNTNIPVIKAAGRVRVTNLRQRQQTYGEPELHGDNSSTAEILAQERRARLFSVVYTENSESSTKLIVVDEGKHVFELSANGDAKGSAELVKEGDTIEVMADEESSGGIVCIRRDSLKSLGHRSKSPAESLFVKVNEVKDKKGSVVLEAIALSKGTAQNVRLKDGSIVNKGEVVIGDDTGEIKLLAWGELASKLDGIEVGERIRVIGATLTASRMNIPMVQLNSQSIVKKVSGESDLRG